MKTSDAIKDAKAAAAPAPKNQEYLITGIIGFVALFIIVILTVDANASMNNQLTYRDQYWEQLTSYEIRNITTSAHNRDINVSADFTSTKQTLHVEATCSQYCVSNFTLPENLEIVLLAISRNESIPRYISLWDSNGQIILTPYNHNSNHAFVQNVVMIGIFTVLFSVSAVIHGYMNTREKYQVTAYITGGSIGVLGLFCTIITSVLIGNRA